MLMNTTQNVPWGLWVALYIFFLGLSAGSFLLSTLVYVFGVKSLEPAGPLALVQALGCLVLGGILIILDLGHPARIFLVMVSMNPASAMAWMGFFYNIYIAVIVAELYLALRPSLVRRELWTDSPSRLNRWLTLGSRRLDDLSLQQDRKWLKILGIVGIPVAVLVHGGVGSIFAVAKARPNWFSGLFPIIFLISALASGGALLAFLTAALSKRPAEEKRRLVRSLMSITIGILAFDLLLLFSEILVTFYGGVPHEVTGWKLTLFGPYWGVFWFVQILGGSAIPLAIFLHPSTRNHTGWLGLSGLLVVVGIIGTRLNIVIPPQINLAFPTLSEAYHHMRFSAGYFPSPTEWFVGLGVVALGIWAFLWALKVLPLEEAERLGEVHSTEGGRP